VQTTNDPAFGLMEFNYGWCKTDEISFFAQPITVEILAEAEIGQPILDVQRSFYTSFCKEIEMLSSTAMKRLTEYYIENLPAIGVLVDDPTELPEEEELTPADLIRMVVPKTLFFPQDDLYAILCDCLWEPINGLAIIMDPDGVSIGTQNEVL
jgi:hypothetical protein